MVVRDRLKELQDKSKHYKGDFEEVEMKPLNPKQKSNTNMDQFFQASEEIAVGLSEIQKNIDKIRQLQKRVLNEPSKVERDKFQGELNDLTDVNKSLGAKVQRLIKNEIEANNKIEEKPGMSSQQLSELRIRFVSQSCNEDSSKILCISCWTYRLLSSDARFIGFFNYPCP